MVCRAVERSCWSDGWGSSTEYLLLSTRCEKETCCGAHLIIWKLPCNIIRFWTNDKSSSGDQGILLLCLSQACTYNSSAQLYRKGFLSDECLAGALALWYEKQMDLWFSSGDLEVEAYGMYNTQYSLWKAVFF